MTVTSDKLLYIISPERLHHFFKSSKLINQFERVFFAGEISHTSLQILEYWCIDIYIYTPILKNPIHCKKSVLPPRLAENCAADPLWLESKKMPMCPKSQKYFRHAVLAWMFAILV
jgi:hypothetical protein